MKYRTRITCLWLAAIVVAGLGWWLTPHEFHHEVAPFVSSRRPEAGPAEISRSDFFPSDSVLASTAPFRLGRAPARWAYGMSREQALPAGEPSPTRPMWTLTGIVRSRPALVVFELTDGTDGSKILYVGETEEAYLIRSVRGDTVFVARDGKEWTFVLENPWGS